MTYGTVWLVKETTKGLVDVAGAQGGLGEWNGIEGELTARTRSDLVEL